MKQTNYAWRRTPAQRVPNLWFLSSTFNNQLASSPPLLKTRRQKKKSDDSNRYTQPPPRPGVPPSPLTIRKCGDRHVLGGDAGAVAVVGEEAQRVLGELLQPLQPVGEPVHLHVLAHRDDKPRGNVTASATAMPRDERIRGELFALWEVELNPYLSWYKRQFVNRAACYSSVLQTRPQPCPQLRHGGDFSASERCLVTKGAGEKGGLWGLSQLLPLHRYVMGKENKRQRVYEEFWRRGGSKIKQAQKKWGQYKSSRKTTEAPAARRLMPVIITCYQVRKKTSPLSMPPYSLLKTYSGHTLPAELISTATSALLSNIGY